MGGDFLSPLAILGNDDSLAITDDIPGSLEQTSFPPTNPNQYQQQQFQQIHAPLSRPTFINAYGSPPRGPVREEESPSPDDASPAAIPKMDEPDIPIQSNVQSSKVHNQNEQFNTSQGYPEVTLEGAVDEREPFQLQMPPKRGPPMPTAIPTQYQPQQQQHQQVYNNQQQFQSEPVSFLARYQQGSNPTSPQNSYMRPPVFQQQQPAVQRQQPRPPPSRQPTQQHIQQQFVPVRDTSLKNNAPRPNDNPVQPLNIPASTAVEDDRRSNETSLETATLSPGIPNIPRTPVNERAMARISNITEERPRMESTQKNTNLDMEKLIEENRRLKLDLDEAKKELVIAVTQSHGQLENMINRHATELNRAKDEAREYYSVGKKDGITEIQDQVNLTNSVELKKLYTQANDAALSMFESRVTEALKERETSIRREFNMKLSELEKEVAASKTRDFNIANFIAALREGKTDESVHNVPMLGTVAIPEYVFDFNKRRLVTNLVDTLKSKLAPIPSLFAFDKENTDDEFNEKQQYQQAQTNMEPNLRNVSKYVGAYTDTYTLLIEQYLSVKTLMDECERLQSRIDKYELTEIEFQRYLDTNVNDNSRKLIRALQTKVDDLSNEVALAKQSLNQALRETENIKFGRVEMEVRLRETAQVYSKSIGMNDKIKREKTRWELKENILQKELAMSRRDQLEYMHFFDRIIRLLNLVETKTRSRLDEMIPSDPRQGQTSLTKFDESDFLGSNAISRSQQIQSKLTKIENHLESKFNELDNLLDVVRDLHSTIDLQHERLESLMEELENLDVSPHPLNAAASQQSRRSEAPNSSRLDIPSADTKNSNQSQNRPISIISENGEYLTNSAGSNLPEIPYKPIQSVNSFPNVLDSGVDANSLAVNGQPYRTSTMVDREVQTDPEIMHVPIETLKRDLASRGVIYPLNTIDVSILLDKEKETAQRLARMENLGIDSSSYQRSTALVTDITSSPLGAAPVAEDAVSLRGERTVAFTNVLTAAQRALSVSSTGKILSGLTKLPHEEVCIRFSKLIGEKIDNEKELGRLTSELEGVRRERDTLRKMLVRIGSTDSNGGSIANGAVHPHIPRNRDLEACVDVLSAIEGQILSRQG